MSGLVCPVLTSKRISIACQPLLIISGAVFTVTGNGRVTLYSDPEPTAEIKKDGAPWSVDELIETVPLPCSRTYVSSATRNDGDDFAVRGDRADQHTAVRGTPPETRRAAGPTTR
jgi:hypothetical protein